MRFRLGVQEQWKYIIILKIIHEVVDKVLGLVEGLPNLRPFALSEDIGMGLSWTTLIMSFIKVIYVGRLQWGIMIKYPTVSINLYDVWVSSSLSTIFQIMRGNL